MTDSIVIKESDHPVNEDTLTLWESQGLSLISVNHVLTHEYPPWMSIGLGGVEPKQEVVRWVYHFRKSS